MRCRTNVWLVLFALLLLAVLVGAAILTLRGWGDTPAKDPADTSMDEPIVPPEETEFDKPHEMRYSLAMAENEAFTLTPGQKERIGDFMTAWYTALGTFEENSFAAFFAQDGEESALRHAASLRTMIAIRSRALEDLRLDSCDTTLTVTNVETEEEGTVLIGLTETSVMRFAGLEVDSYLYDMPHTFGLRQVDEDVWELTHHEADDNPFFTFTYEEGSDYDKRLPELLRAIERRHLLRSETAQVVMEADHPYDRTAAEVYMRRYCDKRNLDWYAYDDVGGNCMNYGSQVLLAGGIPMDEEGDEQWYWHDENEVDVSFINVGRFQNYARDNEGFGLVADIEAGYYTGEVGDILILGIDDPSHTTVISGVIKDEAGKTIDYLLCSNTTNYRDFPAGAYYYTNHRLIKIFGYNDK